MNHEGSASVLLFTGKGGVGKSTLAAATAVHAAASGRRVHLVSTDAAHSLGDVFGREIGDEGIEVRPGLTVSEPDTRRHVEASWEGIQATLRDLVARSGVDDIQAAEVSIVPGADELVSLSVIAELAADPELDAVVVDCAPTAETVRLLSAPQVLSWWVERLAPVAPLVTSFMPALEQLVGIDVTAAAEQSGWRALLDTLAATTEILTDTDRTGVRLVAAPNPVVAAETRRAASYVSLFGLRVDRVFVNRVLPDEVTDPFFAQWREVESDQLGGLAADLAPAPVAAVPLASSEIVGLDALERLGAAVYGEGDGLGRATVAPVQRWGSDDEGAFLDLAVGPVDGRSLELGRRGQELHVAIGPNRRSIVLPDALQSALVRGASIDGETLRIRFAAV